LKRGKNSRAEKIRRRGMEKREERLVVEKRRAPERSGSLPRGGSCRCHGAATLEKLEEDLFAAFNSSQQGNKPHQPSASDQEAMCSIPAERNSRGLLTMRGVGKRNGDISC